MNIKIVIALVVVIILIVVGVFLTLKQTPEQSQEAVDSLPNAGVSSTAASPAGIAAFGSSTGVSPCSSYQDNDVNLSDACIKDIWFNVAKCPNNSLDTIPYYIDNKGTMTKLQITNDAKAWASMTDDGHRKACYGDDKTKWPASYIRYLRSNRNYLHY